jgi:hypothetical protein
LFSLFFLRPTANYGNCYIFNTALLDLQPANIALPGPTYGLSMVLNIEQKHDYMRNGLTQAAGGR